MPTQRAKMPSYQCQSSGAFLSLLRLTSDLIVRSLEKVALPSTLCSQTILDSSVSFSGTNSSSSEPNLPTATDKAFTTQNPRFIQLIANSARSVGQSQGPLVQWPKSSLSKSQLQGRLTLILARFGSS